MKTLVFCIEYENIEPESTVSIFTKQFYFSMRARPIANIKTDREKRLVKPFYELLKTVVKKLLFNPTKY